jgi:hypothetical protein
MGAEDWSQATVVRTGLQASLRPRGRPKKKFKRHQKQVKAVARKLLLTLNEVKLALDWRKKLRTRADVLSTVKTVLNDLPRIYNRFCRGMGAQLVHTGILFHTRNPR